MRAVNARKKVQNQPVASEALQGTAFDLAKEEARVKVLRQTSVESVSNVIATQGFTAGLKELGKQTGKNNKELQNLGFFTRMASKASIGGQGAFLLFGDAMSKVTRFLGPVTLLLSIAGPLFVSFAKFIGLTSKESDNYNKKLAATAELQETFNDKLEHSQKTLAMLETDDKFSFTAQADALAAANAAIMEYIGSINDLIEAEEELIKQRKNDRLGPLDSILGFFRGNKIEGQVRALLKTLGESGEGLISPELIENLEANGIQIQEFISSISDLEEAQKKQAAAPTTRTTAAGPGGVITTTFNEFDSTVNALTDKRNTLLEEGVAILTGEKSIRELIFGLSEGQDQASQNIKSAIEGATDSVREFQKNFITKTDIDKPLSSIIALNKSLDEQVINGKKIN